MTIETCDECGANQAACHNAWEQHQRTCCRRCGHEVTPFECPECYADPFEYCFIWDDEGLRTYDMHPVRMDMLSPPPTAEQLTKFLNLLDEPGQTARTFGDLADQATHREGEP